MNDKPKRSRLGEWFEQRTHWREAMHEGLDEPIRGGSRWAYVFGSALLFIFVSQVITGVALTLYYVPSADHAHTTVSFIQKQVTSGSFVRSIHSYGSSAMVILLLLHLAQTFIYGSYKRRRELLWLVGCVLFVLVLGMSFTGYLLPWDQKAYSATAVATNIISEVPFIGDGLKALLRGGTEMGTLTISRFFTLHVFVIPAFIIFAIVMHVFLFRRAGAAGPPREEEEIERLPVEPFYPRQVVKDFIFGIALILLLGGLAIWAPTTIGPRANPADPTYLPRPEWYYIPVFQWLKYWHGRTSVVGIVVAPALLFALLFALPFLDRSPERRFRRRPIALAIFGAVWAGLFYLGARSHFEDQHDPAVREKLAAQEAEERAYAKEPFAPEVVGGPGAGAAVAGARELDAAHAKGAVIFVNESCSGCHGAEGKGGAGLFKLSDFDHKYPGAALPALLKKPNQRMTDGGMEPVALKDEDLEQLVGYLRLTAGAPR